MSKRRIVTGRLPRGVTSAFKESEEFILGRRILSCEINLFDPQQTDAVGPVVERHIDVFLNADIRFNADQLAVESLGRLSALVLATNERCPPGLEPFDEFVPRRRLRRDHDGPAMPVNQEFRPARDLGVDARNSRDRGNCLFAGQ